MDLHHAALALQGIPSERQSNAFQELLWHAHVADKYVKRLGKLHPIWGDGSLRAAALMEVGTIEKTGITESFLVSLAHVSMILAEKSRRARNH